MEKEKELAIEGLKNILKAVDEAGRKSDRLIDSLVGKREHEVNVAEVTDILLVYKAVHTFAHQLKTVIREKGW